MVKTARGRHRRRLACAAVSTALISSVLLSGCGVEAAPSKDRTENPFTVRTIDVPYARCTKPNLVGSTLFTGVQRGVDQGSNLIGYDIETGETEVVRESPGLINWIAASEQWLVWSEDDQLFAKSMAGGQVETLTSPAVMYSPSISGDLMAYDLEDENRNRHVAILDLRTRESKVIRRLNTPGLYNHFLSLDGDRLAWTDVIEGRGWYFLYDHATGITEEWPAVGTDFTYPGYAQLGGDKIYSMNADRLEEGDWSVQQLGHFAPDAPTFVPITDDSVVEEAFKVTDQMIAFIDSDQRMWIQRIDGEAANGRWHEPVRGAVNFVEKSPDGTLLALSERADGDGPTTVHIIRPAE